MNLGGSDGGRAQGIVVPESFECVCALAPIIGWTLCAQIPVGAMSVGEVAQITAAFVVVLAPLNWLVDNYSSLADCLSSVNLVASLLVALDDLERNPNGTDGVMSRRKPNACGEKGADDSQKISFGVRGRLSRFRSYPTVRHRHRFTVWALTSARHWTGHRAKRMKDNSMDKDRIKGTVEQAKGAVKEAVGKVAGDAKLEVEGRNQKAAGKVQNAVDGVKDAVRDALKK